ncbi:lipoprotein [Mycoplasma cottewii]|uniref:Lipoprotein n=1 Tax=Mycoplasma cottewii TaxID=51364 RepID=A0ABY5TYR5_9MOLU|nr:lipoprotein [Mycoplasma cottewii]UWD35176.1 lipoprotein [Mycoplasma cottewii]
MKLLKKLFLPLLSSTVIIPSALAVVSCYGPTFKNSLTEAEQLNQINILSEINKYFEKHDHSEELVKFTDPKASGQTVEFGNIMKNNYAAKYIKFDENKFKQIVKEKFNLSDNYLKGLTFQVDYTNITRDFSNNFDVVFPIKVRRDLESHKRAIYAPFSDGLFSEQIINFRLKNVKVSKTERIKLDNIKPIYEKLKKLDDTKFSVEINSTISEEIKNSINEWGIHELSSKQLESIFKIKIEEFEKLKTEFKNNNIEFKATIFDVDFLDSELELNEGLLKVRLAVRDVENNKPNAETGVTSFIKFKFDQNDKFWNDLKLNEIIKVNTIKFGELNTDFFEISKDHLYINFDKNKFEKVNIAKINKGTNFRNANLVLEILTKENKQITLNKTIGVKKYANLYEEDFVKRNINAPNFATEMLTQENLKSVNKDFFRQFNSELFSGGYASSRGFYGEKIKTPIYMHIGEDYLANDHQAVLMPYDGKIIAAYELTSNKPFSGVGTVLVAEIPVKNLDWSPKEIETQLNGNNNNIYMSFLHLDAAKTLNNERFGLATESANLSGGRVIKVAKGVTPKNPVTVTKNTIIGYLGDNASNGGWMSHAHVNLYTRRENYLSENYFSTKTQSVALSQRDIDRYNSKKEIKDESGTVIGEKEVWDTLGNIGLHLSPQLLVVNEVDPITGEEIKDKTTNKPITIKDEIPLYVGGLSMVNFEKTKAYGNPNLVYRLRDNKTASFDIRKVNNLD